MRPSPTSVAGPAAPAPIIASSKALAPRLRHGHVLRGDLVDRLNRGLHRKLTLVDAPAGSGKTTLLAEWVTFAPRRLCWVSLDESDDDAVRFWRSVIAALQTIDPELGSEALQALRASRTTRVEIVPPLLSNDLSALHEPAILVIDDYHHVREEEVHEEMAALIAHLPPELHLAISTRSDPPLPLARLRARGEMTEIRARDLRFSSDEAAELLNDSLGLGLSPGDIELLLARTEGWAAGLYLAALSLEASPDRSESILRFSGTNRHIVDYLADEALRAQPEDVRDFLVRTSILERMSGGLCDHVLDRTGSAELLDELDGSNLFLVPLDDDRGWYRYHHLFGELLQSELVQLGADEVRPLHARARDWFSGAGDPYAAVRHSLASDDPDSTTDLIARNWLVFERDAGTKAVRGWIDQLPREYVERQPRLCAVSAWAALNLGDMGAAPRWLELASTGQGDRLFDGADRLELVLAIAQSVFWRLTGDIGRAIEAGRRARAVPARDDSPWRVTALVALGSHLYWAGAFAEARELLEEAVEPALRADILVAHLVAAGYLAAIHLEEGDADTAEDSARAAIELAKRAGLSHHHQGAMAHVVLGRVSRRRADDVAAGDELRRGVELARASGEPVQLADGLVALSELDSDSDGKSRSHLHQEARTLLESCADPGALGRRLLESVGLPDGLASAPRHLRRGEEPLSDRQRDVLRLLPTDLTQREIGAELFISFDTVSSHTRAIYRRLGVSSRADAVQRARELGLL